MYISIYSVIDLLPRHPNHKKVLQASKRELYKHEKCRTSPARNPNKSSNKSPTGGVHGKYESNESKYFEMHPNNTNSAQTIPRNNI